MANSLNFYNIMKSITQIPGLVFFLLMALLLSACEIEGGVPLKTPGVQTTQVDTATPTTVVNTAATAVAIRRETLVLGLVERPPDFYPYTTSITARRAYAPVGEMLFPSPILPLSYGYTNTGVLERIPSLENGDAQIKPVDVYLDAAGNITTTVTTVITQVNQIEINYHWNPKLRWSDGTPVTAADSVFAYELAKVAAPGEEARLLLSQTARYEQIDTHTTRATLQPGLIGPDYFLSYWLPLPRHVLQGVNPAEMHQSHYAQQPLGYGPYMIEDSQAGELRLTRNPHYYGTPPPIAHVTVTFMRDLDAAISRLGQDSIDVVAADRVQSSNFAALQASADKLNVHYQPNPIWEHIDFNLDTEVLQNINVRRAIAMGTNRKAMVEALYGTTVPVLESWILPEQPLAAPLDQLTRYPYDAEQARKLLDEAGYTLRDGESIRSSSSLSLTLRLITSEGAVRQAVADMFVKDMQAIGIEVEVVALPSNEMFALDGPLFTRGFDLALYAWIAGPNPGGLQLWGCTGVPSEKNGWRGENFAGWCFRDADRAIRVASTSLDTDERKAQYLLHQKLWTQEVPVLPLFQRLSVTAANKSIQNIKPDALAPVSWNIAEWVKP